MSLVVWSAVAWGQSPADPPPAPAPEVDPYEDIEEIVIEGESQVAEDTHAHTVLDEAALQRSGGDDLGETVAQVAGVVSARGGADATKPVIRGQVERRLLVLFDGVRHESQKWGQDHATEIDPFAAGSVVVVKGAAGVRYGPDAIGGVVLVEPPPLRTEVGFGGRAQLVGVDNGRRGIAALRLDGVAAGAPGLSYRVEGDVSHGSALRTPDYVLGNTASTTWNLGATFGARIGLSTLTASFRHYDFEAGVCYCVGAETPADFLAQLDDPVPLGSDSWTVDDDIERPYQQVEHELGLLRGTFPVGQGSLKLTYAFQLDHRREYEPVRDDVTGPQYDFVLRTHSLDGWLGHGTHGLGETGTHEGGFGFDTSFQENVYGGIPLIPSYRAFGGGLFVVERVHLGPFALEGGARGDHLARAAFLTDSAFSRHLGRDTLDEEDCEVGDTSVRCAFAWTGGSLSLGGLWRPNEQIEARLDLSSANRFPNADELLMNGSAPTSPVYALGDPDLGVETTWGASPTVGWSLPWLSGELSGFANLIDDYIYFAPELGADGEPAFDVTIQGAYPRWSFRPVDAVFYGADGGLELGPEAVVGLQAQGAVVRGIDADSGAGLVMVPPDRVEVAVIARPPIRPLDTPFARLEVTWVGEQTRVDPDVELAPPPPAYVLLGASIGADVPLRHSRVLRLGLAGNNLTNTRYRDYTSLLRYSADEPGRELRMRVGLDF